MGIYHAHYMGGTGLGLVIGIDGVRDVLENQRLPRIDVTSAQATLAEDRRRQATWPSVMSAVPLFFPFADRTVRAQRDYRDGAGRAEPVPRLPAQRWRADGARRARGQALPGCADGSSPGALLAFSDLDPSLREPLDRLADGMWHALRVSLDYRAAENKAAPRASPPGTVSATSSPR